MRMIKYKLSNITAKKGVNYFRTIVEDTGCLFHKIEQENDLGIDAIIEFIEDEKPSHKSIATQIKSGPSYYNSNSNQCSIPVKNHYEYWLNYPLDVCGIVYVPNLNKAYWTNIKKHLKKDKEIKTISFKADRSNQIDEESFRNIFLPNVLSKTPQLCLNDAVSFFDSEFKGEFFLGTFVLFRKYVNEQITWQKYIDHIKTCQTSELNPHIIYYLAHINWHGDIWYRGDVILKEIKVYVRNEIDNLSIEQIAKILSLISEESLISRGSIGQSIDAILSSSNGIDKKLKSIIEDKGSLEITRTAAAIIFAYKNQESSLEFLKKIPEDETWYIPQIVRHIEEFKYYNPYQ